MERHFVSYVSVCLCLRPMFLVWPRATRCEATVYSHNNHVTSQRSCRTLGGGGGYSSGTGPSISTAYRAKATVATRDGATKIASMLDTYVPLGYIGIFNKEYNEPHSHACISLFIPFFTSSILYFLLTSLFIYCLLTYSFLFSLYLFFPYSSLLL
jgi:hypothetical protein